MEFSHFPLHSSCARKFGSPSCRNRNGFFANPIGGAFFKNHSYYSTSNRRNQLFFATFHSKIANLFIMSFAHGYSAPVLVISYNSLFYDGFHPATAKISPGFPILFPSARQGQMCGICAICCSPRHRSACFLCCTCNKAFPVLHFAGFRSASFTFSSS